MKDINEQYKAQYREIKKRYRKRKIIISAITGTIAISLLTYTYLSYKHIIEYDDFNIIMCGLFGIGSAIIAVRTPFHQTHNEYIELRDLNSAYTHERFRNRNG